MIAIVNHNKKNNKFLPMISLVEDKEKLKKAIKKQLIEQIINEPESLKAYKEIEVFKIADVNEEIELTNIKKEILFTYEKIFDEIIKTLTKEQKKK